MRRLVEALVAFALGWLGIVSPAAGAIAPSPAGLTAYGAPTYDAPESHTATERGPPSTGNAHTTYAAVGYRPHGVSVRLNGPATPSITTFGYPAPHVQVARATATTGSHVVHAGGDLSLLAANQDAANAERRAFSNPCAR